MTLSRCFLAVPLFALLACSNSSAQSGSNVESLRKEVEALKASQAEMQKSLDEIREFLKAATGGRFGRASLVDTSIDIAGAPANGSTNAPITIVEISDYHCPFCRRHVQQTQPQIYSEYVQTGKARHVFLHYPIEQLHPDAYKSHEAASCAADQGKFWELHAKLFEVSARTEEQIAGLAFAVGLDVNALKACMSSGKYKAAVRDSVEKMQALGVSGTPMFLVGKTPSGSEPFKAVSTLNGAQPFAAFKKALDAALQ
jgi:protein-disulfide isomerase